MTVAATVRILWQPNPGPQTAFLACPIREILYGGAKGGGKSEAVGPKALKHIEKWGEWACVLILRETYPQLKDLMKRMRPLCLAMGGRFNKTDKTWLFPSGAQIIFGHTTDGCDPYWGQEYSLIIIDEVTRTIKTKEDYDMLLGSLRNSHGIPCAIVLTSNPGGEGHAWVQERFMGVPPLTVIRQEIEDPETGELVVLERVFIPAKLSDNPKLPREYRLQLQQMNDKERKAYLHGDWNAFVGEVFNLTEAHIWTWERFKERTGSADIPDHWPRFRLMDWGYSHPFCILWIAVDEQGRGYVYREWYGVAHKDNGSIIADKGVSLQPSLVAERIKYTETKREGSAGEKIAGAWTGPDMNSAGTGDTSAGIKRIEYVNQEGVWFDYWTAGPGSRAAKKTAFEERLYHAPGEWPGLIFLTGSSVTLPPGWGEMTNGAKHCIRTIPTLEYDPAKGGEDINTKMEDHPYDAIAGFCQMRPWKAKKPENELERQFRERKGQGGTWMSG